MSITFFSEISIIIGIAFLISAVMRFFKQPLLIGYIITGILVSPYFLNIARSTDVITSFAHIGVVLLLFLVGLNLTPKVIKDVGLVSIVGGLGQIFFTAAVGFFIVKFLGFSLIVSLYIAVALTFSSTVIIMKLLADKGHLDSLYGKISVGVLLIQDFVVILILMAVSAFNVDSTGIHLSGLINSLIFLAVFLIFGFYLLPKIEKYIASSQEFLFLFAVAWVLLAASTFDYFKFSIEIGALLAGITLSISPYHYQIGARIRPLRDFFIVLFFVLLGSQLQLDNIGTAYIFPIIILSVLILVGNPLIMMILMGLLGYTKRTGFFTGLTVAQISEFSLILIAKGVSVGHLAQEILSMVTIIGLITIAGSVYLIMYAEKLYLLFSPALKIFERKGTKREDGYSILRGCDALLFGYNRIGLTIFQSLKKIGFNPLVIDYNPEIINLLKREGINYRYGDADDQEFLNDFDFSHINMIISTIPDYETNLLLIKRVKSLNERAIVVVVSHSIEEAKKLYEAGANYVIMPHFLGGRHAGEIIERHGFDRVKFDAEKFQHLEELSQRKELGHEHPKRHEA